ncbi:MAG: peptidoglycan-binding protein, partial [Mesorhizobium sp.]
YTEVGEIDGRLGDFTRNALLAFQTDNGLPLTGVIDHATLAALDTASPRKVAPARETAPPDLVREKVPEVRSNWLTKVGAFFAGIFALLGSLFDGIVANLGVATDKIEPIKEAFGDVPGWLWFLLLAGVAAGVWLISSHGEKKGVEAFQSGARR